MIKNETPIKIRGWLAGLLADTFVALAPSAQAAEENTTWVAGITEAVEDATLSSSVLGIVRTRPFQEGARVNKGDVILTLDNRLE